MYESHRLFPSFRSIFLSKWLFIAGASEDTATIADAVTDKLGSVQLNGDQNGEAEDGAGRFL